MNMSEKSIYYLLLFMLISYCQSAKILGGVFTPSYSHQSVFQPIWRELSLRGHQVTVLTTDPVKDPSLTNLTEIDLSMSYEIMKSYKASELLSTTNESIIVRYKKYMEALHVVADAQLSHPEVQHLINNRKGDFDLLMVEAIYPTQMAFSWWFQVPYIGMISLDAPSRIHAAVGNPIHPVLYPDYDLPFDRNLTFRERLISAVFSCFMTLYSEFRLHPREEVTIRKHFGDDAPSINDIQKNMSALFINVNPIFHNIRPLVPATVQIGGGLHLQQMKPLSQDIQEYLDGSTQGFIYFSLGTNVKSAALPQDVKEAILTAFSELPYNILWKFEETSVPNKPPNVKIVKWVKSQTAVLNHKNIKAFITQCGLQSMEEAIYYRVPMVGLPFYGDQGNNAKVLERKGLGVKLNPEKLNKEELLNAILEVTSNPIYKRNVRETAELYSDEMQTGLQKAVWWAEYVIRHKGARHLRSHAVDVPLYQYLMLDVFGFVILLLLCVVYILKITFKSVFKLIQLIFTLSRQKGKIKNA